MAKLSAGEDAGRSKPPVMCVMRMLGVGGGPAALYLVLPTKHGDAARTVRVVERNRPCDTFGRGVVFSAQSRACHSACRRTNRGERMSEPGAARLMSKMPSR